jgi:catechol 2,3-dioxygenase-like lactoylglutathione lyase family enzyme
MKVRRIEHVQLAMPRGEEDAARAFYEGLLGIPEVPKPPKLAVRGGCWFELDDLKIHLGVEDGFRPARKAHPALEVDDVRAFVARFAAVGIGVVEDPIEGYDRIHVDDPFGNRIELVQPLAAP